jgi:hypothetical protein
MPTPVPASASVPADVAIIRDRWLAAWPASLALWSRFTRLSEPRLCLSLEAAEREGLTGSFAMIRLDDKAVVVNLALVGEYGLDDQPLAILGHEIGHHVLCPADLTDQGRLLARMRRSLPTIERFAPMLANMYADLLINDRLQRSAGVNLASVYTALARRLTDGPAEQFWTLYMRMYEILWSLSRGQLAPGRIQPQLEGDAQLGARMVRVYARDWLEGSGGFAALFLPYLTASPSMTAIRILLPLHDLQGVTSGSLPYGLTEIQEGELRGAIHPAFDPRVTPPDHDTPPSEAADTPPSAHGQHREPFEYGQLLRALGLDLTDHEAAVMYYRERAAPYVIRYPTQLVPRASDPLPEGLDVWDAGSPLEDVDWIESAMRSPHPVPGLTTVQRAWGATDGDLPHRQPLDLDLYVDCSGSMPNPQREVSHVALAGAIVALSALRAGARVQATLWSGPGQFESTRGFVTDSTAVLRIVTGYLGGSTAFPVHLLRDTYATRTPANRPIHILAISDDGITTMFEPDERGDSGRPIARMALVKARGGGTLVLNVPSVWAPAEELRADGWRVAHVASWEELVGLCASIWCPPVPGAIAK